MKSFLEFEESKHYDQGSMAALKGKKYSDNPYQKGSKEHLDWSKGHNDLHSRKSMSEESKQLDEIGRSDYPKHWTPEQKKAAWKKELDDSEKNRKSSYDTISKLAAQIQKQRNEEAELDESADFIQQHLADKDINSKVEGKTVKVHSSDVASTKKHLTKAGYRDHKVVSGLNEDQIDELDKSTLGSYIKKAHNQLVAHSAAKAAKYQRGDKDALEYDVKYARKEANREGGIKRAVNKVTKEEVENLDEAIEIKHDRYERSHGKKARDSGHPGHWMFTHKQYGDIDHNDESQVHSVRGTFSDAKKSAKSWAKTHGHRSIYVMEEAELGNFDINESRGHKILAKALSTMATRKAVASGDIKLGAKRDDPPFEPSTPTKRDQFGNEIKDKNRAKHLAKLGQASVKKEESMLTYMEFMEKLEEGKIDDLKDRREAERERRLSQYDFSKEKEKPKSNVTRHYAKSPEERDEDEVEQTTQKRGRGRPAGSKSGARR